MTLQIINQSCFSITLLLLITFISYSHIKTLYRMLILSFIFALFREKTGNRIIYTLNNTHL